MTRRCSINGCERTDIHARGWCRMHYFRWRRSGDVGEATARQRASIAGECCVEGCRNPDLNGVMCSMHATRVRRHGSPDVVIPAADRALPTGDAHPNWSGSQATYDAVHQRMRRLNGPARDHACNHCGRPARHWAYKHGDPQELVDDRGYGYSLDPSFYIPLCVPCHKSYDLTARQNVGVTA